VVPVADNVVRSTDSASVVSVVEAATASRTGRIDAGSCRSGVSSLAKAAARPASGSAPSSRSSQTSSRVRRRASFVASYWR